MLQSNIAFENVRRLVSFRPTQGQLSPDCDRWSRRSFLDQHGLLFLKVFLQCRFARKRNRRALGVAFEMFIMDQRFANHADV